MAQTYSNPKQESDPYALPDLEVWRSEVYRYDCHACGSVSEQDEEQATADPDGATCPACERQGPGEGTLVRTGRKGWYWWSCFPGCLPASDPHGPFDTEDEALTDAREGVEDGDEGSEA